MTSKIKPQDSHVVSSHIKTINRLLVANSNDRLYTEDGCTDCDIRQTIIGHCNEIVNLLGGNHKSVINSPAWCCHKLDQIADRRPR